jgi:tetratricopeptide (TPR) repeat protein
MKVSLFNYAWQRAALGLVLFMGLATINRSPVQAQTVDTLPTLQESGQNDDLPLSAQERSQLDQAIRSKQLSEAERLLAAAYERHPDSAELLKTLARISFQNENYWNAAIAYKKAEKIAPLDERSRFSLAMAYIVLDHRDWASPELQKLAEEYPKNPLYTYWLGRIDYDNQRFEDAIGKFDRVIALDPSFFRAYDNLGLALEGVGRHDDALRAFETAIEWNSKQTFPSPWPPLNLGTMFYRLGRVEEAEPYLRDAVRYGPDLAQAQYQLGALLENRGEPGRAIEHLTRAAELDPADPKPHYVLGRIYRRQGDEQKARAALARFSELEKKRNDARKGPR